LLGIATGSFVIPLRGNSAPDFRDVQLQFRQASPSFSRGDPGSLAYYTVLNDDGSERSRASEAV
jgi:hypothetical protein